MSLMRRGAGAAMLYDCPLLLRRKGKSRESGSKKDNGAKERRSAFDALEDDEGTKERERERDKQRDSSPEGPGECKDLESKE